jgi:hypothetical protein
VTEQTPSRTRRWPLSAADTAIVAVMVAMLVIGLGRFVIVAGAIASSASQPGAAGTPLTALIAKDLVDVPIVARWWGGRFVPRPKGDDYLEVLTERSTLRTLGPALGTVIERQKALGVEITQVIVPEDNDRLLGGKVGTTYKTAGGGTTSTSWAPVGRSAANFTATPFPERAYDPVLTDAQVASLELQTRLTLVTRALRMGEAAEGDSGTWVLYSHPTPLAAEKREFLLIPVEIAPQGNVP